MAIVGHINQRAEDVLLAGGATLSNTYVIPAQRTLQDGYVHASLRGNATVQIKLNGTPITRFDLTSGSPYKKVKLPKSLPHGKTIVIEITNGSGGAMAAFSSLEGELV